MVGETLGNYRIVSEIGQGGMGVVYLAEHTLLGRKAAVKLLRSNVSVEQIERFFTEAKAAATLHHPGLVDVFDFGHHTDGSAYIVMEFLPGENLAERLDREPRLSISVACWIARSVATALHVAHDLGIVHRDLKPGNIFLVPDEESPIGVRTKVLDFGIAKLVRETEPRSVRTHSGAVIGTPRYMSPEQCKNARNVDGRSDIYSLGCILYEMLLGRTPFEYDSWGELVGAHIHEQPPKPTTVDPALPADVETLILKMLEKTPADRFQSMQDLAQSLEVLLRSHGGGERTSARLTPPRLTPPAGVQAVSRDKRASDPTLPSGGAEAKTTAERSLDSGELDTTVRPGDAMPFTIPPGAAARSPSPAPEPAPTPEPALALAAAPAVPPAKRVPWVAIGIGAVGVASLVVAAIVIAGSKKSSEAKEPAYIVVDQRGSDLGSGEPPPGPAIDAGTAAIKPVEVATDGTTPAAIDAGVRVKPPTQPDTAQLARAFSRQTDKVEACLREHPEGRANEMSVRFQVDTNGSVLAAEVQPPSVASTPLGACLAAVARQTSFGPQPKPVAFRVPLLTKTSR